MVRESEGTKSLKWLKIKILIQEEKMAAKVFISFRFNDGEKYKEELSEIFDDSAEVINCSENVDREGCSDETIKKFLYSKLKSTSVTIVLLTPDAINHRKNGEGKYDDWMYDEIRYSLEDRENNRCNGLIAVYTEEAEKYIIKHSKHICSVCNEEKEVITVLDFDNLVRGNVMNVHPQYKTNKCNNIFDRDEDSYCSLISWKEFKQDYSSYIKKAVDKREHTYKYEMKKHLQ